MDLFKYIPPANTILTLGTAELVTGWDSLTWVERYLEFGEFELQGKVSPDLIDALPLGAIVSNPDSKELMIVENREISHDDSGSVVTYSGRSLLSRLEQRLYNDYIDWGGNALPFDNSPGVTGGLYGGSGGTSLGASVITWLKRAFSLTPQYYADNAWSDGKFYDQLLRTVLPPTTYSNFKYNYGDDYYKIIVTMIEGYDIGIKTIRPGPWIPEGDNPTYIGFAVYDGVDRTASVLFSDDAQDIISSNHLQSIKGTGNTAIVVSKWDVIPYWGGSGSFGVGGLNDPRNPPMRWSRLWVYIDGRGTDETYNVGPTGTAWTDVHTKNRDTAKTKLPNYAPKTISNVEISKHAQTYEFRKDYDIGDLVSVNSLYQSGTQTLRVIEHVEIEDQNGFTAYPVMRPPF